MRKKKEQVESPVIPPSSPSIPTSVPAPAVLVPVKNPSEEAKEVAEAEQPSAVSLEQPLGLPTAEPSDVDMFTSSPAPEPEPVEVKMEVSQFPQPKFDSPSESWHLDPQVFGPGVVVDLRQDSAQDCVDGVRGVIESVVNLPGCPITASFKPIDGKAREIVISASTTIPVRPSKVGEVVIILSGEHKGKIGRVIKLGKGRASVGLHGLETTIVDFEPSWLCLFSREDRVPLPDPTPLPPLDPPEKGDSISSPPAPQSEDGEILLDPPPRSQSQQSGNLNSSQVITPLRAAPINAPTQPRSFQNTWKNNTSAIPSRSNSLSHLLNANSNGGVNTPSNPNNTFANPPKRPSPPSGPKALRGLNPRTPYDGSRFKSGAMGSGLNGNGASGLPVMNGNGMGIGLKRELNPNNGHPGIPRGPSADRERERDRTNGSWSTKNWGSGWR